MARRSPALLTGAVLLAAILAEPARAGAIRFPPDPPSLAAAERAFAHDAATKSLREAFLTWLADDALIFRPQITPGRPFYTGRPVTTALLAWEPAFVAVARSGELGYSTGPWSFRATPQAAAQAWGDFVSIWQRLSSGEWRVAIDVGVSHGAPVGEQPRLAFAAAGDSGQARHRRPPYRVGEAMAGIGAADEALAGRLQAVSPAEAYRACADPALRLYRDDQAPYCGRELALAALATPAVAATRVTASRRAGVRASLAGDLGYAWGECDLQVDGQPRAGTWLRIWSREPAGACRLVLDVLLLLPAESPGAKTGG